MHLVAEDYDRRHGLDRKKNLLKANYFQVLANKNQSPGRRLITSTIRQHVYSAPTRRQQLYWEVFQRRYIKCLGIHTHFVLHILFQEIKHICTSGVRVFLRTSRKQDMQFLSWAELRRNVVGYGCWMVVFVLAIQPIPSLTLLSWPSCEEM